MTPQEKANELYPVNYDATGEPIDHNDYHNYQLGEAYIKGREDERAELSGTPDEAEEVLGKPDTIYLDGSTPDGGNIKHERYNKDRVLKAMQTFAASRVAEYFEYVSKANKKIAELQQQLKEEKEKHEVYGTSTVNAMDTIEELQQSNQRLTAEVEEWKGKFNECDNAFRNVRP